MTTFAVVAGFVVLLGGVALVKGRGAGGDDGSIPGTASGWDITAAMSRTAMWLSTIQTRPRTRVWPWSNPAELGVSIGRCSWWGFGRRRIYASFESTTLAVGPPGVGKSGWLARVARNAPGPAMIGSSAIDLWKNTHEERERRGPVSVLNPENVGDGQAPTTMYWPFVDDCAEPRQAILRAGDFIAGASAENLSDASWWENHAHRALYSLLMAAALDRQGPATVAAWTANLRDKRPVTILENHPDAPDGWAANLSWLHESKADKMVDTIAATLKPVMEFMAEPALAAAVLPGPGRERFDAHRMLTENGSLFTIASDRGVGALRPLMGALTAHVHETAKRMGAAERLDPPLVEVHDEAGLTAPVPLHKWTSDSRKHGIQLNIGVQSKAQLADVLGDDNAATAWSNCVIKLFFGSIDDHDTLKKASELGGERIGQLNDKHERVPVLSPDRIKRMPDFTAAVMYRNRRPVAPVDVDMVWDQRDPWWRRLRSWLRPEQAAESVPVVDDERVVSLAERRKRAA